METSKDEILTELKAYFKDEAQAYGEEKRKEIAEIISQAEGRYLFPSLLKKKYKGSIISAEKDAIRCLAADDTFNCLLAVGAYRAGVCAGGGMSDIDETFEVLKMRTRALRELKRREKEEGETKE